MIIKLLFVFLAMPLWAFIGYFFDLYSLSTAISGATWATCASFIYFLTFSRD